MDSSARPSTVAVVLAAGGGTRFRDAGHKLDATLDGETLAGRSIRTAIDAGIGDVLVVTGAAELTAVIESLRPRATAGGIRLHEVHNDRWADGQATSLRRGVDTAAELGADAVVVGLADQPFVTVEAWRLVAASDSVIAVATYDDLPRNPVRLHSSVWSELPDAGDSGARPLIRLRADLVERIPCPGSGADIDTVEELRSWQNRSSTNSP